MTDTPRTAAIKTLARPASIYAATVAICIAAFTPWVTPEKMLILLTLGGWTAGLRSYDKKIAAAPG